MVGWLVGSSQARIFRLKSTSPRVSRHEEPCQPFFSLRVPRGARGGELFLIFETERMRFRFGERSMVTDSQPFRLLFKLCLSRLWPNEVEICLLEKLNLFSRPRIVLLNRCSGNKKRGGIFLFRIRKKSKIERYATTEEVRKRE